jgi:hypothetical protein
MDMADQIWNRIGGARENATLARRQERGVALLLTIFGLLLLTAVAMAMMFASDAETAISVNYRDSQVASYSAASALQEARERIHPVFGDLAIANYIPTNTPDAGVANGGYVLYIVNPGTNETVASMAPWSATIGGKPNPYFDQEFCQEGMLGVTRQAAGVACSGAGAIPAGGCTSVTAGGAGWCKYYDNSANATNWQLKDTGGNPIPLDYKWVRVTMKEDWNTPVYVPNSASASGQQVCWDGVYQGQRPANYNSANCAPTGGNSVTGLNLTAAGAGYTSVPTVTIAGGGGSGATATAVIAAAPSDGIASVVITNPGSGYTSPPTVTISPTGATFQAQVASSAVTGVTINPSGSNYCYTSGVTPNVNFSTIPTTNTIANATATVSMNTSVGCVSAFSQTGTCNSTTAGKVYPITSGAPPGGGSGFAGSVTFANNHKVNGISITTVGSGYKAGSATIGITDNAGKSCTFTPSFSVGAQLSTITVGAGNGGAYMTQPAAALGGTAPAAPNSPIKPALTALPNPWPANASAITAINVTAPGTGYTPATHYPLTITGGGGTGAAGYAIGGGTFVVSGFSVTNGGAGYTSQPTVTVSGGGGTGTTATATVSAGTLNTTMAQLYLLTSFAMTKSGSKSMAQMEAGARPPFALNLGGAISLAGPELAGDFTGTNSNNFMVNGDDANSCNQVASNPKPAVGVWDSASQTNVIADAGTKPQNYIGAGAVPPNPSIEIAYTALGGSDLTPDNLYNYVTDLSHYATSSYTGTVTTLPATTLSSVTYVDGDLTLSGNPSGSGILVVTGTLTFSGNFTWNGIVLVVGQGQVVHNGGGNGNINGAIYVAQITQPPPNNSFTQNNLLPAVGNPQYTWNGGGVNTVQYDHCKADALLQVYNSKPSNLPLQVLSMRTLQY